MREALALERGAPLRARIEPLGETAARTTVDGNASDVEFVGVHVVIVAGVGDGTAHELLDRLGGVDIGKLQQDQRLADALAADGVGHPAQLARGGTHESQMRDSLRGAFVHVFTVALSPPCPRKWRVGANSPSLWPTMFSLM